MHMRLHAYATDGTGGTLDTTDTVEISTRNSEGPADRIVRPQAVIEGQDRLPHVIQISQHTLAVPDWIKLLTCRTGLLTCRTTIRDCGMGGNYGVEGWWSGQGT